MYSNSRLVVLLIPILLTAAACNRQATEPEKPVRGSFAQKEADASKHPMRMLDPDSLRNMSNLLAGRVDTSGQTEDADDEAIDPVWVEHSEFMNEAWKGIDERLLQMRQWAEQERPATDHPEAPVLYPFGGPDLISAMQFFPDASSYLLVGLEAPGHLPSPEDFSADALAADLERLRKPFNSFVEHGYFVRNEIDKDLSGGQFDGVLPILLIGLVRAGQVPINLQYVSIDPETYGITPLPPSDNEAQAVAIHFVPREQHPTENPEAAKAAEDGKPIQIKAKAVYYFAKDLSNNNFFPDDPFSQLIQRQNVVNSYLKSAEYLLHTDDFSNFRKLLLKKSHSVLQDDSGVPIRFLTSDTWDIQLYGQYSSVLAAYSSWLQEDLVAAYAKGKDVKPLGFTLGYNSKTDGGCLILGTRKADAAAGP